MQKHQICVLVKLSSMKGIYIQHDFMNHLISNNFLKNVIKIMLISRELKSFWVMKQMQEIQHPLKMLQMPNIKIQIIRECMVFIIIRFLRFLTRVMQEVKEEIMLAGACNNSMTNCSEKGNKSCRTKTEEEGITPL